MLLICFPVPATASSDDEDSDSESEMAIDPLQVRASLQSLSVRKSCKTSQTFKSYRKLEFLPNITRTLRREWNFWVGSDSTVNVVPRFSCHIFGKAGSYVLSLYEDFIAKANKRLVFKHCKGIHLWREEWGGSPTGLKNCSLTEESFII